MTEPNWSKDLKSPHLDIAQSTAKKIGVLAGPGTGKTSYGLMRRVARLLEEGESGENILLFSFTRTASTDLKSKLSDLGTLGAKNIRATTIHGYCFGLLQKKSILRITGRAPRPLLDHEKDLMLRDLEGDFGNIHKRREKLKAYEAGWARSSEDYLTQATLPNDISFQSQAISWLKNHGAILIGEVVPLTYRYLSNNPATEELSVFKHILVDEYQDLNILEQELIELLSKPENTSICVVGDDDQSIYRFRHANPKGILNFINRDDVEKHEILTCGRSPKPILEIANALIANAPNRNKQPLSCRQEKPGSIDIIQWPTLEKEINGIITAITHDLQQGHRSPGDILVLTSRQYIGKKIRDGLRKNSVEAHSYFKEEPVKTTKARVVIALLNLLANPKDKVSWRVMLGLNDPTGRSEAYKKLRKYSKTNNKTEIETLEESLAGERNIVIPALVKYYKETKDRLEEISKLSIEDLIEHLMPENDEDTADLRQLALEALEKTSTISELYKLLIVGITQPNIPHNPTFVRIMSLHKSKGLTSPCVYIVGAIDGLIPFIDKSKPEADQEEQKNEQRRLLYVAITRSSDQLVISSSLEMGNEVYKMRILKSVVISRKSRAKNLVVNTVAMPFLEELGPSKPNSIRGEKWLSDCVAKKT